jgi:hypothetical protein
VSKHPFIVDPVVLAELGHGDADAGATFLRMAIADMRERKPINGPTARPDGVRVAVRSDEPAIEELLAMDAAENAAAVASYSAADVQDLIRPCTRETGKGLIGVIDGPDGDPVALVVLGVAKWWWSSAFYLCEQVTFVHPDHRSSRHAQNLVLFARYAADKMTEDMGQRVFLMHGVTATNSADRKVRFLGRFSNYVGSFFIYPHPKGNAT